LVALATNYTARYTDVSWVDERRATQRIYLVGHQPELFHPGVWLKNFVLDVLAKRDRAVAVHVLIDNDDAHTPAVRVPSGSLAEPHITNVPFDTSHVPCAWEERKLQDVAMFRTFGARVAEAMSPLVANPLARELWRAVDAVLSSTRNLGQALAQLRHRLEVDWGVQSLEIPLSTVVDTTAFQRFATALLADLPRFHAVHNAALNEYRVVHKLRSPSQPLPNLSESAGWLEAPFWVWTKRDPTRRKLMVKQEREQFSLRDGVDGANKWSFSGTCSGSPDRIGAAIDAMSAQGTKIRPRALVTTMLLRVLASDLFIHGIGGAKYDQVTDRIINDFLGLEPLPFLTTTGTLRLPFPHVDASVEEIRRIERSLRELRFQPERYIQTAERSGSQDELIQRLIADKRRWLQAEVPPEKLAERHAAITEINAALEDYVSHRREELTKSRNYLEQQLRRQAILGSREYSFCLFPATTLRPWLLDAAAQAL
jgi:hypothetical protein